ncbi:MAG: DnaD domain protein [Solobacterium sp.]|nr:DnaD domain protein [Solobacterium sp.]
MKWYEQNYVNHRDWILDNVEELGLNSQELVLVLLIDFYNEHHMEISMEILSKKCHLEMDELDRIISVLCARKYLDIKASSKRIRFVLDGLFEANTARDRSVMDISLFELFEQEFGRTLSQKEMQKISDWNREYERKQIVDALREASTYQKLNLSYIEAILKGNTR